MRLLAAYYSTMVAASQLLGRSSHPPPRQPHDAPVTQGTHLLLWTRNNPGNDDYYKLVPLDAENLSASPFVGGVPCVVLVHGFGDHGTNDWILEAKTALLLIEDMNVISVDWEVLVKGPWYGKAIQYVYKVGRYVGESLDWLGREAGLGPVHLVGHSLGAHTAAMVAKDVTARVARLTGLDPAGPRFYGVAPELRFDKSHADFVDVIHTNSGPLIQGCQGLGEAVGHVDFYPNGGRHQPGCKSGLLALLDGCSHQRAPHYWVESIVSRRPGRGFVAWPCRDWPSFLANPRPNHTAVMGYHVPRVEGRYCLYTASDYPYALGSVNKTPRTSPVIPAH